MQMSESDLHVRTVWDEAVKSRTRVRTALHALGFEPTSTSHATWRTGVVLPVYVEEFVGPSGTLLIEWT